MKKIWKIIIVILCLCIPLTANATETQDELMKKYDFTEIEQFLDKFFPEEKLDFADTVWSLISGQIEPTFELFKELIFDQIAYELRSSKQGIIHIILLVIIGAIFSNFSSVFKNTQVAEISFSMLYMLMIAICLNNFRILVDSVTANVGQIMNFMQILSPLYALAVAIATGSGTSIAFYQLILIVIYLCEVLIQNFLLPLTQIYLIVRVLGELSPEIPLTKFAGFIETIVSWSLKVLIAGIVGINVIQGLLNPAIDSVKRSVVVKGGEAIPMIGDAISGSTEVVLGSAILIKNGIGVTGMLICLIVCLAPIVKMVITALLYQLIAALIQPVSDKRIVNCVSGMADGTKLLLRIICTTSVLFMITIAVVASTTGG